MPEPNENESREEFLERCIPQVIEEGKEQDEAVAICNSLYENKNKRYKLLEIKKLEETEDRTYEAVITSSVIDRDNEVLISNGMDPTEFVKTGGTVFYNHNYDLPVGKATDIKKGRNRWTSKFKIADRPEDYQGDFFPDFVATLIDQGIIKGISVGFQVLQERLPTKKDIQDFGKNVRNVISKWKLLEYSVAPLNANTDALITSVKSAVKDNVITKETAKKYFPDIYIKKKINLEFERKPEIKKLVTIELFKKQGKLYY